MARPIVTLFLVLLFGLHETTGEQIMVKMGLLSKERLLPRTWFSDDPSCYPAICPTPLSHAWHSLNERCCSNTPTVFHCQNPDSSRIPGSGKIKKNPESTGKRHSSRPVSFCMDVIECAAGTYADLEVITMRKYPEEPLCQKCPAMEFQPYPTSSYKFTTAHCHYTRTQCESVDAVPVVLGTADSDDVCECPAYRNFRPVPLPGNDCLKFHASSGCRCEPAPCPEGQVMSEKGYQCLDKDIAQTLDNLNLLQSDISFGKDDPGEFPEVCLGKGCVKQSLFDSLLSLEFLRKLHHDYGLWVPVFCAVVAFFMYKGVQLVWALLWKVPVKYDILICIVLPSPKVCQLVFTEIENSLPLLQKIYGTLTLDHDPDFTHISVIVRPRLTKGKFRLLQFVRDLLSSVAISKYLKEAAENVQIVAVHGSSRDVTKASFKESALKQHSTKELDFNAGEITLKFASEADEARVLNDLKSAKRDLKTLFRHYNLKFSSVRRGSIKFRFVLPAQPDSESFDSLAHDERIKKFVKDLCSYDSFNQLSRRQDVTVEFICKARLNTVSVVQAQNLYVNIGHNNNVYISDCPPQALGNERDDDDNESDDFDEEQPEIRELVSLNVVSVSSRTLAVLNAEGNMNRSQLIALNRDPTAIDVLVKCSESTAEELFEEWTNSMPLLRRLYPDCRLQRAVGGVLWQLPRNRAVLDVTNFVSDLFLTRRLHDIKQRCQLDIDIPLRNGLFQVIPTINQPREREDDEAMAVRLYVEVLTHCVILYLLDTTILAIHAIPEALLITYFLIFLFVAIFVILLLPPLMKFIFLFCKKYVTMDRIVMLLWGIWYVYMFIN